MPKKQKQITPESAEEFVIPYPPTPAGRRQWSKLYGFNRFYAGVHWSKRKEAADTWHLLTRLAMERAGVRRTPFSAPVQLTFWFDDRLDCSNHAVYIKLIEDGMKGRLIADDDRQHVRAITCAFHDRPYIRVRVEAWNGE